MTKEALKLALEALVLNNAEWKHLADSGDSGYWSAEDQNHYKQTEQAITAVQRVLANEALEKMAENARELGLDYEPAQEPVAWAKFSAKGNIIDLLNEPDDEYTPLYTTPPQRTWVGLTRIELIKCGVLPFGMSYELYEAIEQALKERNT